MEHRDEPEENTVGQEVSAHAFPSYLPDAPQSFFHPPPVGGRGLLSPPAEGGGGAGIPGALRPGRPGGPQRPGGT